jgi:hypothetical protein
MMITISAISLNLQATEDGAGSPVDVAKSYMRARLPWGSPAANNLDFRSPSSARVQGTPLPYSAGNFSSSKLKRKSGSNQSWNIQDEIRKVRAKATEEMLKSPSSVASLEPKYSPYVLATDMLKGNASSLNADGGVFFLSLFTRGRSFSVRHELKLKLTLLFCSFSCTE